MSIIPQRAFSRNNHSASIVFSKTERDQNESHKAKMINCSIGGMFFVSEKALNPGENIHIQLSDVSPDPYWPEADNQYFAEVRWCRDNGNNGRNSYAVGVRFIKESCKQCGDKILGNCIDECGLCSECHDQIESFSDDNLKHCISNYLLGNVI